MSAKQSQSILDAIAQLQNNILGSTGPKVIDDAFGSFHISKVRRSSKSEEVGLLYLIYDTNMSTLL